MRRLFLTGAALSGLVLAPAAAGWTKLTPDSLQNIVDPGVLVLPNGTELIAYREPVAGTFKVIRGGSTATLVSGRPIVGDGVLAALPGGAIALTFSDDQGVVRFMSSDGGASWSGPAGTGSHDIGDVQAGAARPDGTMLFSQDGTGFVNVFQGGASAHNVFPHCCGYAESLAVDSTGLAQIAFWSNATGQTDFLYGTLDGSGALSGSLGNLGSGQTIPRDNRVPLVADSAGNTYVGFSQGYPTSTSFVVRTFRGGAVVHTVTLAKGSFSGADPLMALSTDGANRVWAVWTRQGAVWAARSRSGGAHFGAAVHVALPGSGYQLEAGARPDGSVDAVVNTGSNLQLQRLLPGLTVVGSRSSARVLDDGFPVVGATLKGGGKTLHSNGQGRASLVGLRPHAALSVSASGYTPAGFRVP